MLYLLAILVAVVYGDTPDCNSITFSADGTYSNSFPVG